MLKAKSHICNIYASFIKQQRLKIYTFLGLLCLFSASCLYKPPSSNIFAQNPTGISEFAVNINTANAEELEKLPRIGEELAQRIIEHREKYGAFRRAEDLMLVRGVSEGKFREIRSLIKVK